MPLFKKMNALIVYDMVELENLKLLYRVENELISRTIIHLFVKVDHGHRTRHDSYQIPKHNLSKYNNSFLVKSVTPWNALSNDLKLVNSIKQFSKKS